MKTFKDYLCELFDKPYASEYLPNESAKLRQLAKRKKDGTTNHKLYKLSDDAGHLMTLHKDGAVEIHHISKNGKVGVMSNVESGKDSANPRFYSTMIHHAREHLDKGRAVRIVARPHQLEKYRKIADHFKNEYEIQHHEDHTMIRPRDRLVEDMFNSVLEKQNETH